MAFTEYVTNALLNLLDQSVSGGGAITITSVQVGSGYPTGGDNPLNFTGLKSLVQTLGAITSPSNLSGITSINDLVLYQSTVRFQVSSQDAPKTYQFNEYGIFAKIGTNAPVLILYVTTNGPTGDTVTPSGTGTPVIRQKATIIGYSQQAVTTTSLTLVNTVDLHASTHLDNGVDPLPVATTTRTGSLVRISGKQADVLHGDLTWSSPFLPGFIQMYGGVHLPANWLWCDGSAVSRATYSNLFAVIQTAYGAGDGSTTFNLPDFLGRTPVGCVYNGSAWEAGAGLSARYWGQKIGEENHVLSVAELAAHAHSVYDPQHAHSLAQNPHSHGVTDPTHAHAIYDPGHGHGVYDPGHGHGVYDPWHTHAYIYGNVTAGAGMWVTPVASGGYNNVQGNVNPAPTGIAIYGSGTNIGIYAAGTGIGIYAAATGVTVKGDYASLGVYGASTGIGIYNAGSNAAHNNMQPSLGIMFIIHI